MICPCAFPSSSSAAESSRAKLVEGGFMGKERKICFTSIDVTLPVSYAADTQFLDKVIDILCNVFVGLFRNTIWISSQ